MRTVDPKEPSTQQDSVSRTSAFALDSYLGLKIALLFVLLYSLGATLGPQASDSAEFMLLSQSDGLAHPPGYPLLLSWLRVWDLLPWGTPAWKASVASGVLGASALGLLASGLRRKLSMLSDGPSDAAGAIASWTAIFLGLQPFWIRYCTIVEAFSCAALVFGIWIWLWAQEGASRKNALLLSASLALMIGGHHSVIFGAPLLLCLLWSYRSFWILQLVGVLLGFASYFLLWGESNGWSWGEIEGVESLMAHFFRRDYGTFQITHRAELGTVWGTPLQYLRSLSLDSWGVFPFFALWGLRYHGKQLWVLLLSWLFSSCVFLALFRLPIDFASLTHSNRFFMAPTILLAPVLAIGVFRFWAFLRGTAQRRRMWQLVFWMLPLAQILYWWPIAGRFDKRMEDFARNSCQVLPSDSIAIVTGDGAIFSLLYAQEVMGVCADTILIFPKLLGYDWYQERLRAQGIAEPQLVPIVQHNIGHRPVFASLNAAGQYATALPDAVPYGGLWMKLVSKDQYFPSPEEVRQHLMQTMPSLNYHNTPEHHFLWNRAAEAWASHQYGEAWFALSKGFEAQGNFEAKEQCVEIGMRLKEGLWFSIPERR